jgi:endonuclease/exonuclease/phosphatase family metal-dependent hydrolase
VVRWLCRPGLSLFISTSTNYDDGLFGDQARLTIAGLVAIILSIVNVSSIFGLNWPTDFEVNKNEGNIRIMTWNIRRFTPYNKDFFDPRNNNLQSIVDEVVKYNPDILCFQEFYTGAAKKRRNLELFRDSLHYPYIAFAEMKNPHAKSSSGTIIFSRYPLIKNYTYKLPEEVSTAAEFPIATDVVFGEDTLRVITFHMQSYGFLNRDYEDLYKIKTQDDTGLKASKSIYRKMQYAFSQRGLQADLIGKEIERSPYPVIACGDMNDVPNSYSYLTIREDMKDAFLEKGTGLGKSFISGRSKFLTWLPTLRIDYIFLDQDLKVSQFRMVTRKLSDHRGLITDIELPKN